MGKGRADLVLEFDGWIKLAKVARRQSPLCPTFESSWGNAKSRGACHFGPFELSLDPHAHRNGAVLVHGRETSTDLGMPCLLLSCGPSRREA